MMTPMCLYPTVLAGYTSAPPSQTYSGMPAHQLISLAEAALQTSMPACQTSLLALYEALEAATAKKATKPAELEQLRRKINSMKFNAAATLLV